MKTKLAALLLLCSLIFGLSSAVRADYAYTVRFYSGRQGTFGGEDVIVITDLHYGDRISFQPQTVTLLDPRKYYVKGIRESGKDNNTAGATSFMVTRDQDYTVAYGVLGNAVSYTVNYLDAQGAVLAPGETFYGNAGDKPVVAYRYIEGYAPEYYNITRTLSENAGDNVFDFIYYPTVPSDDGQGYTVVVVNEDPTDFTIGPNGPEGAAPGPGGNDAIPDNGGSDAIPDNGNTDVDPNGSSDADPDNGSNDGDPNGSPAADPEGADSAGRDGAAGKTEMNDEDRRGSVSRYTHERMPVYRDLRDRSVPEELLDMDAAAQAPVGQPAEGPRTGPRHAGPWAAAAAGAAGLAVICLCARSVIRKKKKQEERENEE
jgi:hypothetical protein